MSDTQLFLISMWVTVLSAGGVALWLWLLRHQERSLSALAGFCLAMAVWCLGHILVVQTGSDWGTLILLGNPLLPTTFLHFALNWLGDSLGLPKRLRRVLPLFYFTGIAVTIASFLMGGGEQAPWLDFPRFFHLQTWGWLNLGYTVFIGVVAHLLLFAAYLHSRANLRRSIVAMFATGAWGFILATSFIAPSLHFHHFPYPMLALPSYAVLVVYSLVRYRLVRVNRWVSFGIMGVALMTATMIVMSLLVALMAQLGIQSLARIPLLELVIYSAVLLAVAWGLYRPMQELAERVVYPGGRIDQRTLNHWVTALNKAESWAQLAEIAETLWKDKTGLRIPVLIAPAQTASATPCFHCRLQGEWLCDTTDWNEISPSLQHLGEIFARLLASACGTLERSLQLAETQQKRLEEQHLVELGGLTAAIAHELRNPLNIITMAATQTEPAIREHISTQVKRSELLIKDILSYAGRFELQKEPVNLTALLCNVCTQMREFYQVDIQVDLPEVLTVRADASRMQQVFVNLMDNAAAFVRNQEGGRILVTASQTDQATRIAIHNNGPAISAEMVPQLFQPFVSKRSGGSGLGLAIVRRIMDGHQGRVWHSNHLGWPVTFLLELPTGLDSPVSQPVRNTP